MRVHYVRGSHLGIMHVALAGCPIFVVLVSKASLRCHIHMLVSFILNNAPLTLKLPKIIFFHLGSPWFTLIHLFVNLCYNGAVRGFCHCFGCNFWPITRIDTLQKAKLDYLKSLSWFWTFLHAHISNFSVWSVPICFLSKVFK